MDVNQAQQERVWRLLEQASVVPFDGRGRIPAFTGAEAAAVRLAELPCGSTSG